MEHWRRTVSGSQDSCNFCCHKADSIGTRELPSRGAILYANKGLQYVTIDGSLFPESISECMTIYIRPVIPPNTHQLPPPTLTYELLGFQFPRPSKTRILERKGERRAVLTMYLHQLSGETVFNL
jgi:hypothetical protein